MESYFLGEETGVNPKTGGDSWCFPKKVKYLNNTENLKFKVKINNNRLLNSKGEFIDTLNAGTIFSGKGKAIFVMDNKGNLFISKFQERHLFHHSSLLSGKPVSAAGEIKIIKGMIKEISIKSGHYQPSASLNQQILLVLKEYGVETKNIKMINKF
jgi:hypothetical protein